MTERIEKLLKSVEDFAPKAAAEIEEFRIRMLGKKGEVTAIFEEFKQVSAEQKRELGQRINRLKTAVQEKIDALKASVDESDASDALALDLSRPGTADTLGTRHPISLVRNQIVEIFSRLGYVVAEGPEIEDDWHVFSALNFPPEHPARDMQDTFWLTNGMVLRTHTSNMQVRMLEAQGAPLAAIFPGRCFRYEAVDASHENTFYQLEGLMVGPGITIANLIAVMRSLLSQVFHQEVTVRLRPGYFPFVEPGFELDCQCLLCAGAGCKTCKQSGWIELLPCGMVHPRVLRAGGVDSRQYSGFAFGLGLTRLAMMKYNIPEIRLFNSGDARFLEQFPAVLG